MSFDEEPVGEHDECLREIHNLHAENDRLREAAAAVVEALENDRPDPSEFPNIYDSVDDLRLAAGIAAAIPAPPAGDLPEPTGKELEILTACETDEINACDPPADERFTWRTEDCNFRRCDTCEHLHECDDAEPDLGGDREEDDR